MFKNLIEANELKELINRNNTSLVVLDCRFNLMEKSQGYELYKQGHIPGAYYVDLEKDLSSPVSNHGGRHPLPSIDNLQMKLQAAGINAHTLVVVYCDSRFAYASRAWWLLKSMGHKQVKILNGGYKAWLSHGGTLDRREPAAKSGNIKLQLDTTALATRDELLTPFTFSLIDSREAKRFAGLEEPIDPIAGHIPGAVNFFWQDVTDEKGFMKPREWQIEHWHQLALAEKPVVYCGSGVTACVNLLSLDECDIPARLYAGSWSDWCSYLTPSDSH